MQMMAYSWKLLEELIQMFYCLNNYNSDDLNNMTVCTVMEFLRQHPEHLIALKYPHAYRRWPNEMALQLTIEYQPAKYLLKQLEDTRGCLYDQWNEVHPYIAQDCPAYIVSNIHDLEAYPLLGMEVFDDHIALKVCA